MSKFNLHTTNNPTKTIQTKTLQKMNNFVKSVNNMER